MMLYRMLPLVYEVHCRHFFRHTHGVIALRGLQLCAPATARTLSPVTPRLVTSSKPFHPPRYLLPCTSDAAFADVVRVYKFELLT